MIERSVEVDLVKDDSGEEENGIRYQGLYTDKMKQNKKGIWKKGHSRSLSKYEGRVHLNKCINIKNYRNSIITNNSSR